MKNNFYLLCFFSFLILTSCNQKETKHIIVKEGIGFENVVLYRTTKSEIYKLFGADYKQINHNNYSIEDYYEKLGISFYHICYNKKRQIEFINFDKNFYGKTSKGFDIQSMKLNDILRLYGNPHWGFSKKSDMIQVFYWDLGIEFRLKKTSQIPDLVPKTFFTNDIYINRLLYRYFKSEYGNNRIEEFQISLRDTIASKSPYLGKSEIDSVFPINTTKESFGILGNRLKVKLPEGLKIECVDQSNFEFEKNKQSFMLNVLDYNCLASDDMKADVAKIVKSWGTSEYNKKNIIIKNDVSIYVIEPHKFKLDDNGNFWLKSVFVKNCDNTILYLSFDINTNAWYNLKNYQRLANEIIQSIQAGNKQLYSKAETVQIKTRQRKITINKPTGLIYSKNIGPDFRVFVFKKLVHFNEQQSSMLVYIGNHPNYIYNQNDEPVIIEKKNGLLFGQKVEWNFCYKDKKTKFPYTIEGICKFDSKDDVHVALKICSTGDTELFKKSLPETQY
jgi:hypothetical protein